MKFAAETVSGVLGTRIIVMETRRRALEELLIEKEIISKQELEEKYELVKTRDGKKLYDEIFKQFAELEERTNK